MMDIQTLYDTAPWEWPENAAKFILEALGDDHTDESDRLMAVELAGDFTIVNDELAEALLSILHNGNESEEVRGAAAIALGPALENAFAMEFDDPEDILISEETFHRTRKALRKLFMDADVPKDVRRRILEAAVRAPQDWHGEAIRAAYAGDDDRWKLTAVFCMRYIRGFEDQILEALSSNDPEIHYQAVHAAGNWEVDAAWPHITALIAEEGTKKDLLLAAIDAVVTIRPKEAPLIIGDLIESDDDDVVDAVHEALGMAEALEEWEDWEE
jgi:uncharacterized protein (UPF0147 family)